MGLVNIQNTNFENGITNRNAADLFGSMGQLDPTKFHTFYDDFDTPIIDAVTDTIAGYTSVQIGTDSDIVAVNGLGGIVDINSDIVAANQYELQTLSVGYSILEGQAVYFRSRLALDDVTNAAMVVGLTFNIAGFGPDNGIFFRKADASETLSVVHASDGTETEDLAIFTVLDGVFFTCEFYWDGIDRVGSKIGSALPSGARECYTL